MATLTLSPLKFMSSSVSDLSSSNVVVESPEKVVADIAEAIATYYIPYHLRRTLEQYELQGLPRHYLIPPQQPPKLYTFIANICTQMEKDNSDFFTNLPESMNLQPDNAKTVFLSLCETVFSDEVINWGRILSIITLASTFAAYFTKKGELSVVTKIPCWLRDVIVMDELMEWIIEQGGWDDCINTLSPKESSNWSRMLAYGAAGVAAAGFFLFRNGKLL